MNGDRRLEGTITICDLSPFYCGQGGGIRTYHRARIDWFRRQTRHRYVLITPGPSFATRQLAPAVTAVEVYGPQATRDRDRYRLLLDYRAVRRVIDQIRPDVLEVQDPWISSPIGLLLRRHRAFQGLLTFFCHSDPLTTYVGPFLRRWLGAIRMDKTAERLIGVCDRGLAIEHRQFAATFVASETMRTRLLQSGVRNVIKVRFGVDAALFALRRLHCTASGPRRLLYAGRLDDDKEFGLVLDILPTLLQRDDVQITVIGCGKYERQVAALRQPRLRYLGFVGDRESVRRIYAANDVLLAPGRFETFGLAALEAMAAGLAVVGPHQGGTGEILRQLQSPLAFEAGDRRGFLDRILAAVAGDGGELAERGRAVARGYGTWSDTVARHVAIYESMVADEPIEARADRSA